MKGRAVLLLMVGLSGMGVLRRRMGARGEKVKMGSLMVSFLGGKRVFYWVLEFLKFWSCHRLLCLFSHELSIL